MRIGLEMPGEELAVDESVETIYYAQNDNFTSDGNYFTQRLNVSRSGDGTMDLHDVSFPLGGTMLSIIVMVVIFICYCCQKNIRKHQAQDNSQYWRAEPDVQSLDVFTMDSHAMCYERTEETSIEEGTFVDFPRVTTAEPPPTYESLIFDPRNKPSPSEKKEIIMTPGDVLPVPLVADLRKARAESPRKEDEDLPSYETALKLQANGYI